jgi:C4-dicarboxylate transporter DctM subunit
MGALANLGVLGYALLGGPLFVVIALSTLVAYHGADPAIPTVNIFVAMGALLDKPHLLPIALFIFSGYLLAHSGTPRRTVRLAEAIFGTVPGGLAIVAVVTCSFFTAFTGASGVTIVAIGGLLYPILAQRGYPERFNLGVLTASGSLGLLFFPSLPVFILATVYSLSAGSHSVEPEAIFAGGVVPGLLMVVVLSAWAVYSGVTHKVARTPFDLREVFAAARGAIGEVLLPVALIAVFQLGLIGIHEVATFIAVYVLFIEVVLYRDIHPVRDLPRLVRESMVLVGAIFMILAVVLGMNNYLKDQKIPQMILGMVQDLIDSPVVFLLALNVFLLIIGCLMDVFSAIVAVLPLIIPLAEQYQIEPVHLAIIFLANLEIGYLTPPVGLNLFISAFQFRKPVLSVYRAVVPAIGLLIACLVAITYIPSLTLALPRAMGLVSEASAAPGTEGAVESDSDSILEDLEGLDDSEDYLDELAPAEPGADEPADDEPADDDGAAAEQPAGGATEKTVEERAAEEKAARDRAERLELEKLLDSEDPEEGAGDEDLERLLDQ